MASSRRILLGACVACTCFVIASWQQAAGQAVHSRLESRRYVPRHERIAASILKRKQAMQAGQSVSAGEESSGDVFTLPISDAEPGEVANDIVDAPPMPSDSSIGPLHGDVVPEDSSFFVDVPGAYADESCATCGPAGCDSAAGCTDCGPGVGADYCWIDSLSVFGGVHGFKNAANRGQDGSFGFHEGVNWGWPCLVSPVLSTQLGFQAVHSNFNGASFSNEDHTQYFVTGGIFKRTQEGLQAGVVYDHLHDSWYFDMDLGQVRGELSWAWPGGSSLGFQFATSVADDSGQSRLLNQVSRTESWETRDWYTAFYRVKSNRFRRGEWRLFAGVNGDSDGLIGSDVKVPMVGGWSLEPSFMYMIPDEPTGGGGNLEESWNLAINLVWYPGSGLHGVNQWHRPLFDVADNGSMIIGRR